MKITIGSDHRGYALKEVLKEALSGHEWFDVGTDSATERVDYPLFSTKACNAVLAGKVERGILLCGSGIGMSIAANRFSGIYAALCWNVDIARMAREHDLANVLVLPADIITSDQAIEVVQAWLQAEFKGGRYEKRLAMIERQNL